MLQKKDINTIYIVSDHDDYVVFVHDTDGFNLTNAFDCIKDYVDFLSKQKSIVKYTLWNIDIEVNSILRSKIINDLNYASKLGPTIEKDKNLYLTSHEKGYEIIVKSNKQGGYYLQLVELLTDEPVNAFANVREYIKFIRMNRDSVFFTLWSIDNNIDKNIIYKLKKELEKYPNDVSVPVLL